MASMPAYIIVQVEVEDSAAYDQYRKMVAPTLEAYGGRFLVRGGRVETIEGDWRPGRVVVIEFENLKQAKAWWSSDAYRFPKSLRQKAARSQMIAVEGVGSGDPRPADRA